MLIWSRAMAAALAIPLATYVPAQPMYHFVLISYLLLLIVTNLRSRLVMTLTRTNRFAVCLAFPARAKPSAERKQETNDASRQRA